MSETVIKDAADFDRAARYSTALVDLLGVDPRVRRAYSEWRRDHDLDQHHSPSQAYRDAVMREFDRDVDRLQRLVTQDLGCSFDWLPLLLLGRFRLLSLEEVTGTSYGLELVASEVEAVDRGRRVKNDGDHVKRDVEWFYRRKVKQPADDVAELAREYAKVARRRTDSRSVVQNGIKRAERFLSMPCLNDESPSVAN